MNWIQAALWGIAGGFVVEGLEFYSVVRQHGKSPWNVSGPGIRAGRASYLVAELIRLVVGGILAGAAAASGQVSGALAAVAVGVATPLVVERLTALVPLGPSTDAAHDPVSQSLAAGSDAGEVINSTVVKEESSHAEREGV